MTFPAMNVRRMGAAAALAAACVVASAACVLAALPNGVEALGAIYVLIFLLVAWRWPLVALSIVFASACFTTDLSGGGFAKFSFAELHLMLLTPVFLLQTLIRRRPLIPGPITIPVLLYFAVCIYASAGDWRETTVTSLAQMFLYFVVAVTVFASLTNRIADLKTVLRVGSTVGAAFAVLGLATSFAWFHKNAYGAALAGTTVVSAELWFSAETRCQKAWTTLALLITVTGLFFSLSRGGWTGALSGVLLIAGMRREYRLVLRAALVLVPLLAVCWRLLPQDKQDYAAGLNQDRANIGARYKSVDLAERYFEQSPLYGTGVGLRKEYDATNLAMLTLAETGVLGLAALALIHGVYFRMIWATQTLLARSDPAYSLLAVGGGLVLCKLVHGMVDHYWSRGATMMAWGAAGMATAVYYDARARQAESVRRAAPAVEQTAGAA